MVLSVDITVWTAWSATSTEIMRILHPRLWVQAVIKISYRIFSDDITGNNESTMTMDYPYSSHIPESRKPNGSFDWLFLDSAPRLGLCESPDIPIIFGILPELIVFGIDLIFGSGRFCFRGGVEGSWRRDEDFAFRAGRGLKWTSLASSPRVCFTSTLLVTCSSVIVPASLSITKMHSLETPFDWRSCRCPEWSNDS